jgi:hypothetical protein
MRGSSSSWIHSRPGRILTDTHFFTMPQFLKSGHGRSGFHMSSVMNADPPFLIIDGRIAELLQKLNLGQCFPVLSKCWDRSLVSRSNRRANIGSRCNLHETNPHFWCRPWGDFRRCRMFYPMLVQHLHSNVMWVSNLRQNMCKSIPSRGTARSCGSRWEGGKKKCNRSLNCAVRLKKKVSAIVN